MSLFQVPTHITVGKVRVGRKMELEVHPNLVAVDWQSLAVTLEGYYYYYYYSWNGVIMILIETSWVVAHGG